jgi:hypothetical protein
MSLERQRAQQKGKTFKESLGSAPNYDVKKKGRTEKEYYSEIIRGAASYEREKMGPNMGGKPTKNTDTSYRMEKAEPEKKESFKEAFAKNRKAGNKTFEWNGKKFTTELASEKKDKETPTGNIGSTRNTDTSSGPNFSAKKKVPVEEREVKRSPSDIRSPQEKMLQPKPFGYKKGGSVARGDGCAKRGKTKGRTF